MTHEGRCIEFPCTCVTILRGKLVELQDAYNLLMTIKDTQDRIMRSLEKKIKDGLSCCCSGCTKHNQDLSEEIKKGVAEWQNQKS